MRGQFLEHIKSWHIDAILGSMFWSYNVLGSHAWPISRTCQTVAHWCMITHSFGGKDWTRESEWLEKSKTNQFVKAVCHCHVNVDCVSVPPGDNVLGSHAWRISRTYQIVAHWCNSWVPVASLIDRRIRACVPVCLRIQDALVLQCSRISCMLNF